MPIIAQIEKQLNYIGYESVNFLFQNTEYRIQNTEYRIQNTEYRIQNIESPVSGENNICITNDG